MKPIKVEDRTFDHFERFRKDASDSKAINELIALGTRHARSRREQIALVILEDTWYAYDDNPGQASNAPFLEGLCRFVDTARCYRLNFYDANSFELALQKAVSVSELRIVLYIGAHGTKGKIGNANAASLMKKLADFSKNKRKIEGVILSACSAGGHDPSVIAALNGSINWIFGYNSNVDFIGSIQVETSILGAILTAPLEYTDTDEKIITEFSNALSCFNPYWKIGSAPRHELWQSVRLATRAKHKRNPTDCTDAMLQEAWPRWTFPK